MIDFKEFCSTDELRPSLWKPFKGNGKVYATNGHIAIRAKESMWDGEVNDSNNTPDVDKVLPDSSMVKEWIKLPSIKDCNECENSGRVKKDCDHCRGGGYHTCSCGDEHECYECDGTGKLIKDFCDCSPIIFGRKIQRKYWEMINSLPSVECGICDEFENLLVFRFDGGDGGTMKINEPKCLNDEIGK